VNSDDPTRLWSVVIRLSRKLNTTVTHEGLTPTESSVLSLLVRDGSLTLAHVTKLQGLNPTMVSRVVRRLATLGLIERQPDPGDRRAAILAASDAGREVVARIHAARSELIGAALTHLSESDASRVSASIAGLEALAIVLDDEDALNTD
jgi:DNA-binding MarR family transcriptional regulator